MRAGAAVAAMIALVSASADARPLTPADLVGRAFCWGNGAITRYNADGTYDWSLGADHVRGTWRIASVEGDGETSMFYRQARRNHVSAAAWRDGGIHIALRTSRETDHPGGPDLVIAARPCAG